MKMPFMDIKGLADTLIKIDKACQTSPEIMDNTLKDIVSRAPGKIADAVVGTYNIKKSEVKYNKKKIKKSIGYISVHGDTLSSLYYYYSGRRLTPTHFDMDPKKPKKLSKKMKHVAYRKNALGYSDGFAMYPEHQEYEVSADFKHKRKTFHPKKAVAVFLAPSKGKTVIPWMRMSSKPLDIAPIKTLSLPQMVDNKGVRKVIGENLSELVEKRFNHNYIRHFKKCLK